MKFSIPQKELSVALARCAAIAGSGKSMPILANVLIDPMAGLLRISATDLEVGYTTAIGGLIWDGDFTFGPFLLDAKTFAACVKAIPSGEVTISVTNHIATITGGSVTFTLSGLDAAEYPAMSVAQGRSLTIEPGKLADTIKHVAYCHCIDETRPTICGCLLQLEHNPDGDLFAVAIATDGHRLCLDTNPLQPEDDETFRAIDEPIPAALLKGVIIPAKGMAELIKLAGSPGPAVLGLTGNTLTVSLGDEILSLQLAEGDFPETGRVIPQNPQINVQVKRQSLIDALDRCRIITNKDRRDVDLSFEGELMTIGSTLPQIGAEATDRLHIELAGPAPVMRFNIDYLLQTLANLGSSSIEIHITDALSPVIINPVGTDFPQAIIMPMRIS